MLKILIVDDHDIIRRGLQQILLEEYPSAAIHQAVDAEAAINMTLTDQYDIIICDLSLPGRSGLDVVEHIKQNFSKIPVLILSIHPEEQYAIRALKSGAAGYLCKDTAAQELVKAVRRILQGRKYISPAMAERMVEDLEMDPTKHAHELLSNREFHVLKLIAQGISISEIAEQLSLSITTVSTYRARILLKMNMKNNAEITRYSIEYKLI